MYQESKFEKNGAYKYTMADWIVLWLRFNHYTNTNLGSWLKLQPVWFLLDNVRVKIVNIGKTATSSFFKTYLT